MSTRERFEMRRLIEANDRLLEQEDVQPLSSVARTNLASLMLEAYRGTVDDDGETLDDAIDVVDSLMAGEFGDVDQQASGVFIEGDAPIAATIVTHHNGRPLVAFSMTHPVAQRRGFARRGLRHCIGVLARGDCDEITLVVTSTNNGAVDLYRSMGFTRSG